MMAALIVAALGIGVWCAVHIAREEAAALRGLALLARGTVLEFDEGARHGQ